MKCTVLCAIPVCVYGPPTNASVTLPGAVAGAAGGVLLGLCRGVGREQPVEILAIGTGTDRVVVRVLRATSGVALVACHNYLPGDWGHFLS